MKTLFCTSEAIPFKISGGLGEVSSALPHALRQRFVGCRVVVPLYNMPMCLYDSIKFITSFYVPVAWRNQYCGIFEAKFDGIIYYLIDNEYYFKRDNLYGYYDDAERFAFFSRAILEMLRYIDFEPDIIHANDWQTALIPVYLHSIYGQINLYSSIRTVFSIHNIEYQGKYGCEILNNIIGIPDHEKSILEFDGCVNYMKGAIECSHHITTVSPTYAREILWPSYSHGLDNILHNRSFKLSGILNGIDNKSYNPATDKDIYKNFSVNHISSKAENKLQLQQRLSLNQDSSIPLIGMVTRLAEHKGIDLVVDIIENILINENIQFVILGTGEQQYEDFFSYLHSKYPTKMCACYGFVPELSRKIYAASDLFLMPSKSEPCGLSQMIALRYGSIPIVRRTGGLADSVQDNGNNTGNGFCFDGYDSCSISDAIKRALWTYHTQNEWEPLVKRAMSSNNSWEKSAIAYINLYRQLLS